MNKKVRKAIYKTLGAICGTLVFLGIFVSIGAIGSDEIGRITSETFWNLQLQALALLVIAAIVFVAKQYFLYLTMPNKKRF